MYYGYFILYYFCADNWALVYSQELANKYRVPLMVAFTLVPKFLDATWRQYSFMISGLQEVEKVRLTFRTCTTINGIASIISIS